LSDNRINAFVAGGQRIFVNTGLLVKSATPNEVIGVLAHETGHIAGGHLARRGIEINRLSTASIIASLLAMAAMAGGAAAGNSDIATAGRGLFYGSQSMVQRAFLAYARTQEASADQAAARYLRKTGQSGRGMLTLFQKLASKSMASLRFIDPYVMSHPMPLQRINNLERLVKKSRFFNRKDPPQLIFRHRLMQAKLVGFTSSMRTVYRTYPKSNKTLPARYARAIAAFRSGDIRAALPIINRLIRAKPKYPYFRELKGQALLENSRPKQAIAPLKKAVSLAPRNGLIRLLLAQAQIATGKKTQAKAALANLRRARAQEGGRPMLHRLTARAWAELGNYPLAELETAEAAIRAGDRDLAARKAKGAMKRLKRSTPQWLRANDILQIAKGNK
jgi:predicted Zn-dependent protease